MGEKGLRERLNLHCSVVKLLGGRVHLLTNCVKDAACMPVVEDFFLWSSAGSACTCLRHAQQIRRRWQRSAVFVAGPFSCSHEGSARQ